MQEVKKKAENRTTSPSASACTPGTSPAASPAAVRFHFDMGNGVNGWSRWRRRIKFRVHSDTTHELHPHEVRRAAARRRGDPRGHGIKFLTSSRRRSPEATARRAQPPRRHPLLRRRSRDHDRARRRVERAVGGASRERRSRGCGAARNLPSTASSAALRRRSHLCAPAARLTTPTQRLRRDFASDRARTSRRAPTARRAAAAMRASRWTTRTLRNSNERTTAAAPPWGERHSMLLRGRGLDLVGGGRRHAARRRTPKPGASPRVAAPRGGHRRGASAGPFDWMASARVVRRDAGRDDGGGAGAGANTLRSSALRRRGGVGDAAGAQHGGGGAAPPCVAGMPSAPNLEAGTSFLGGSGVLPPVGLGASRPDGSPARAGGGAAAPRRGAARSRSRDDVRPLMPEEVHEAPMRSARSSRADLRLGVLRRADVPTTR